MAPRNRKKQKTGAGAGDTSTTHPPLDIPEDEQWRLVRESGVLDGTLRPSEVRAQAEAPGPAPREPLVTGVGEPLVKGVGEAPRAGAPTADGAGGGEPSRGPRGGEPSRGPPLVREIRPGEEITLDHIATPGAAALAEGE
ncbi:hypothetical protein HDZ31DRAFT_68376, partial [Schizophyllum fasciatum]